MAKIYANQISKGAITIEQVPEKWRVQVESILG